MVNGGGWHHVPYWGNYKVSAIRFYFVKTLKVRDVHSLNKHDDRNP